MVGALLLTFVIATARADCLAAYDAAELRASVAAGVVGAPAMLMSVGSVVTSSAAFQIPDGSIHGNLVPLIGATVAAGVALPLAGLSAPSALRMVHVGQVRALIQDAQLGDGPTLRAYVADLNAESGRGWSVGEVAAVIVALNEDEAFCARVAAGKRAADRAIVEALNAAP